MSQRMTKPTKWHVRPAKTHISLGIHPVWSESLLSAWRKLGSLTTHWAYSEGSIQTGRMPRLIWVFAGRTCHFVGFVMCWLMYIFATLSFQGGRIISDMRPFPLWTIWAITLETYLLACFAQQRLRSACASMQSDQSLRSVHEEAMYIRLSNWLPVKMLIRLCECRWIWTFA